MFSLGFFCLALGYDIYVSIETYMYEKRLQKRPTEDMLQAPENERRI